MRWSARAQLLTGLLTAGAAPAASGAQTITQAVESTIDGSKSKSTHAWILEDGRFHLTVTAERGEAHFVFNGRTFYACGKLEAEQITALSKTTHNDSKALEPFRAGACQVVPTNFMVRFFLSPMAAVESIDATDGLKLTLVMTGYELTPAKDAGKDCKSGVARRYKLSKGDKDTAGGKALAEEVEETLCPDETLAWRKALWSEVAKAVMRQPRGQELLAQLRKDSLALPGFVTKATISHKTTDGAGHVHAARFDVRTVSEKTMDVELATFRPPEGYKVFSPEDLANGGGAGHAAPGQVKDGLAPETTVFDLMSSAFFCAIASQFICVGGN